MKLAGRAVILFPYELGPYPSVAALADAERDIDWDHGPKKLQASCTVAYAVAELATYLPRLYPSVAVATTTSPDGADIAIGEVSMLSRLLGPDCVPAVPSGPEAYAVEVMPYGEHPLLVIAANGRAGVLYGVYAWLESLGVTWYGPEVWQEVVRPQMEEPVFAPGWRLASAPDFPLLRGFHVEPAAKARRELFVWMARNRLNLWEYNQAHLPLLRKLCFRLSGGGHNWERWMHPDLRTDGGATLFDAHPEWFAEIEGTRQRKNAASAQFCVASRAAREFFLSRMMESLEGEYRGVDILGFWPYDTWHGWCQCPSCRELGNGTDRYLLLAAQARQRIDEAYRQGRITRPAALYLCAYEGSGTVEPPSRPLPPGYAMDHDFVTFFPINRCYAHTMADEHCEEINSHYRATFDRWSATQCARDGRLVIGEYYNVSKFEDLPLAFYATMPSDLRYYHQMGARGINYMHVSLGNWGPRVLTNYLFAQLAWDVQADAGLLVQRFFENYFGAAAAPMREVFELLRKGYANVTAWRSWHNSVNARLLQAHRHPGNTRAFAQRHLHYDYEEPVTDAAISAIAGQELLAGAVRRLALIDRSRLPREIARRIAECESLIRYGEASYRLYLAVAQLFEADRHNEPTAATTWLHEAQAIASQLEGMTIAWPYAWPENTEMNGLAKTQLVPVLEHYRTKYEPA